MGFIGLKVFKLFVLSVCIQCICGKIVFCCFVIYLDFISGGMASY